MAVLVGAPKGDWLGPILRVVGARVLSWFGSRRLVAMLTDIGQEDLLVVKGLIQEGKVAPVIDRCYPLSETPDALRYLETMRARGKVVITM